jgi:hypothetical protein
MLTNYEAVKELQHSVRTHFVVLGGPTAELSFSLMKVIDFLEDDDCKRRTDEIVGLAFNIIEFLAMNVYKSVCVYSNGDDKFPTIIKDSCGILLATVEESRNLQDKIAAKGIVLNKIVEVLRLLSSYTGLKCPIITTVDGRIL